MSSWTMLVIAPSHYCEKARWALQRFSVPFVETPHPPILHMLANVLWGQPVRASVPRLISADRSTVLKESKDIMRYVDQQLPAHIKLYPEDLVQRAEVDRLEVIFNESLGKAVRVVVYEHLLPSPEAFHLFADRVTWAWEYWFVWVFMGVLRTLIGKGVCLLGRVACFASLFR